MAKVGEFPSNAAYDWEAVTLHALIIIIINSDVRLIVVSFDQHA